MEENFNFEKNFETFQLNESSPKNASSFNTDNSNGFGSENQIDSLMSNLDLSGLRFLTKQSPGNDSKNSSKNSSPPVTNRGSESTITPRSETGEIGRHLAMQQLQNDLALQRAIEDRNRADREIQYLQSLAAKPSASVGGAAYSLNGSSDARLNPPVQSKSESAWSFPNNYEQNSQDKFRADPNQQFRDNQVARCPQPLPYQSQSYGQQPQHFWQDHQQPSKPAPFYQQQQGLQHMGGGFGVGGGNYPNHQQQMPHMNQQQQQQMRMNPNMQQQFPKPYGVQGGMKQQPQVHHSNHHGEVMLTLSDTIYQVQFKRAFLYFVYREARPGNPLSVGDFVVTECDRGVDLGVVVDILSVQQFQEVRYLDRKQTDEEVYRVRNILRLATQSERDQLPEKYHDELTVFQHCVEVAQHIFLLPMTVVDAEYQFDRTKLSVYYTSNVRIDFRELVKNVFSTFQTRIWMKKSNREMSFEPKRFAVLALTTGAHFNSSNNMPQSVIGTRSHSGGSIGSIGDTTNSSVSSFNSDLLMGGGGGMRGGIDDGGGGNRRFNSFGALNL